MINSRILVFALAFLVAACTAEKKETQPGLPKPVAITYTKLLNAAYSRNYNALEKLIDKKNFKYSFGDENDPIEYWKSAGGSGTDTDFFKELIMVLRSPYSVDADGNYTWPDLWEADIGKLTEEQKQRFIKLTSEEEYKTSLEMYEDDKKRYMKEHDNLDDFHGMGYIGMRTAIGKDGTWYYYIGGD